MKTVVRVSMLVCAALTLGSFLAAPASAQDAGAIVGWGTQVLVPQSALTDLVAVPGGGSSYGGHSLGLKAVVGDLNCDGVVDFDDTNPFVQALSDPASYAAEFPRCHVLNADGNADGEVNFDDVNPFVDLLLGG